jgi:hypothetical protein
VRRREVLLAAAGVALARPAVAGAAEGEVLDRLILREEAAALAYEQRGMDLSARHAAEHAKALRTHVAALGRAGPAPATAASRIDAPLALERSLLVAYEDALGALAEPSILRTAATIAASHAQHLALLRREAGLDPLDSP